MQEHDEDIVQNQTVETGEEDISLDEAAEAAESEENGETSNEDTDDVEALKEKLAKVQKTNKQLFKRYKEIKEKAAAKPATNSGQPAKNPAPKSQGSLTEDEIVFLTAGHSKQELETVRMIMKGKGVSFEEALVDPVYEAVSASKAAKEKSEKAALGASSPNRNKQQSGFKANMTEAEHKAAWLKSKGQ